MSRAMIPRDRFDPQNDSAAGEMRAAMIGAFEQFHQRRRKQRMWSECAVWTASIILVCSFLASNWVHPEKGNLVALTTQNSLVPSENIVNENGIHAQENAAIASSVCTVMVVTNNETIASASKSVDFGIVTNDDSESTSSLTSYAVSVNFEEVSNEGMRIADAGSSTAHAQIEMVDDDISFLSLLTRDDPSASYIRFGNAILITTATGRSVVSLSSNSKVDAGMHNGPVDTRGSELMNGSGTFSDLSSACPVDDGHIDWCLVSAGT